MRRSPAPSRRIVRALRGALAAAVAATACGSPTGPSGAVRVTATPSSGLVTTPVAGPPKGLLVTIENPGPEPVGIMQCGPTPSPIVDRRTDGRWEQHSGGNCPGIFVTGLVPLAPGARREAMVYVGRPGRYRVWIETSRGRATSGVIGMR